ncbi:MAG: hypothetical protein ACRELG_10100 [Gemmataceae bacterium]
MGIRYVCDLSTSAGQVDTNNRCVPLDAEILVAGSPGSGEANRLYRN